MRILLNQLNIPNQIKFSYKLFKIYIILRERIGLQNIIKIESNDHLKDEARQLI